MINYADLKSLQADIKVLKKFYEIARIVDPLDKIVLGLESDDINEERQKCYSFWGRDEFCANCISMRAVIQNDTFLKVEIDKDRLYLITAIPVKLPEGTVVMELLKDVTIENVFEGLFGWKCNGSEAVSMINRLNEAVVRDDLTGLYNRRYINEKLPVDIVHAKLKAEPISILMVDIDLFKSVNDLYGHTVGDEVLKAFADIVAKGIHRQTDWVARFGGEEFIVSLLGADAHAAYKIAERIRKMIEGSVMSTSVGPIRITASFGVATTGAKGPDVDELIKLADERLLRAKRMGRNRTEC